MPFTAVTLWVSSVSTSVSLVSTLPLTGFGGGVFLHRIGIGHCNRRVVGARDRDGQRGRAGPAVIVGIGVAEDVGDRLAFRQRLDVGLARCSAYRCRCRRH